MDQLLAKLEDLDLNLKDFKTEDGLLLRHG